MISRNTGYGYREKEGYHCFAHRTMPLYQLLEKGDINFQKMDTPEFLEKQKG